MRGKLGHWAVVALIVLNIAALGYAAVLRYGLISQEDNSLQSYSNTIRCRETFSGALKIANPVDGAKTIVSLEYSVNGKSDEISIEPSGAMYKLGVNRVPTDSDPWTLRAFYFNKSGQLSETSQQFGGMSCDKAVVTDLELK